MKDQISINLGLKHWTMRQNQLFLIVFLVLANVMVGQTFTKANNFQKFEGYFDFYYDDKNDKVYP